MTRADDGYACLEDATASLETVVPALLRWLPGCCVLVTAIDSGPMHLSPEALGAGWRSLPGGSASPPLDAATSLPRHDYTEWWVFADVAAASAFPDRQDAFVNRAGWSLADQGDPWLATEQRRFWSLIEAHRPLAYCADGDRLVVVSSDARLLVAIAEQLAPV